MEQIDILIREQEELEENKHKEAIGEGEDLLEQNEN